MGKISKAILILRNNSCLLHMLVFLFYIWNLRLLVGINLKHNGSLISGKRFSSFVLIFKMKKSTYFILTVNYLAQFI